jgi:hypothetical protein
MTPFPPMPPLKVPLPFLGDADIEYAAFTAAPKVGLHAYGIHL